MTIINPSDQRPFKNLIRFMNDIPGTLAEKLHLPYSKEDVSKLNSFTFWWREMCHLIGGIVLGLLGFIFYGVFFMMWTKETIEHAKTTMKEWSDIVAWSLGALIGNLILLMIFL